MINVLWKIHFEVTYHDLRNLILNSWDKLLIIVLKHVSWAEDYELWCRLVLSEKVYDVEFFKKASNVKNRTILAFFCFVLFFNRVLQ